MSSLHNSLMCKGHFPVLKRHHICLMAESLCPEAACPLVPWEVWLLTGVMLISFIFIMQSASELWSHAHHHAQLTCSSHSSVFQELHRWPAQRWSAANKKPNAVSTHLFPPSGLSTCRLSWEPAPNGFKAYLRFLELHLWQFERMFSAIVKYIGHSPPQSCSSSTEQD